MLKFVVVFSSAFQNVEDAIKATFYHKWPQRFKNRGGKFQKKQWCRVGRRVLRGNLILSTKLII